MEKDNRSSEDTEIKETDESRKMKRMYETAYEVAALVDELALQLKAIGRKADQYGFSATHLVIQQATNAVLQCHNRVISEVEEQIESNK